MTWQRALRRLMQDYGYRGVMKGLGVSWGAINNWVGWLNKANYGCRPSYRMRRRLVRWAVEEIISSGSEPMTRAEKQGLRIVWLNNRRRAVMVDGAKVRAARHEAGLSQEELAKKAGVSASLPAKVEAEEGVHMLRTTLSFARALGVRPADLQVDLPDEPD